MFARIHSVCTLISPAHEKLRSSAEAFESAGRFQEELRRSQVAKTGREGGKEGGQRLNERVQVLGVPPPPFLF